jgi:plastocyanin
MIKSGSVFIYIIVVAICLSGCIQHVSNSGTQQTTNASSDLTPSNLKPSSHPSAGHAVNITSMNSTAMNMSAASKSHPKDAIIYLMAKNIAFNKSTITVPAGANVTVHFDNEDSGTPHNFAVYDSSAASKTIFQGELITGKAKAAYTFTAPSLPGIYYFRCDVHPTIMTGQFIVEPSGATAQTGASPVGAAQSTSAATPAEQQMAAGVSIKDYAYDPNTITVPAGTTAIWTNLDIVPHTVTSTTGKFDSGVLEPGQKFNYTFNDPGTYNYYSTIHTYMKGQVIVTAYARPYPKSEIPTAVPVSTTSPQPSTRMTIDLLAKDLSFDKDNITVLAGAQVNIDFYNLDVGMPHNFAVYANREAKTVIYQGPVIVGPKQITYTFNAPVDTGIYYFRCDVHPMVMNGNFYVVSKDNLLALQTTPSHPATSETNLPNASIANESTSGTQEVTIDLTAQNIAFDTRTITVPSGSRVTINFNNKDSGVPHNFAVYTDSSATTVIFRGKIITGPATTTYTFDAPTAPKTYFFRCDIHPTQMNGRFIAK